MNIGSNHARRDCKGRRTAKRHVLADRRYQKFDLAFNVVAGAERRFGKLADIATRAQRQLGDFGNKTLELLVARDEVCFGVDLDDRAPTAVTGYTDKAFGGRAAGLLRSF